MARPAAPDHDELVAYAQAVSYWNSREICLKHSPEDQHVHPDQREVLLGLVYTIGDGNCFFDCFVRHFHELMSHPGSVYVRFVNEIGLFSHFRAALPQVFPSSASASLLTISPAQVRHVLLRAYQSIYSVMDPTTEPARSAQERITELGRGGNEYASLPTDFAILSSIFALDTYFYQSYGQEPRTAEEARTLTDAAVTPPDDMAAEPLSIVLGGQHLSTSGREALKRTKDPFLLLWLKAKTVVPGHANYPFESVKKLRADRICTGQQLYVVHHNATAGLADTLTTFSNLGAQGAPNHFSYLMRLNPSPVGLRRDQPLSQGLEFDPEQSDRKFEYEPTTFHFQHHLREGDAGDHLTPWQWIQRCVQGFDAPPMSAPASDEITPCLGEYDVASPQSPHSLAYAIHQFKRIPSLSQKLHRLRVTRYHSGGDTDTDTLWHQMYSFTVDMAAPVVRVRHRTLRPHAEPFPSTLFPVISWMHSQDDLVDDEAPVIHLALFTAYDHHRTTQKTRFFQNWSLVLHDVRFTHSLILRDLASENQLVAMRVFPSADERAETMREVEKRMRSVIQQAGDGNEKKAEEQGILLAGHAKLRSLWLRLYATVRSVFPANTEIDPIPIPMSIFHSQSFELSKISLQWPNHTVFDDTYALQAAAVYAGDLHSLLQAKNQEWPVSMWRLRAASQNNSEEPSLPKGRGVSRRALLEEALGLLPDMRNYADSSTHEAAILFFGQPSVYELLVPLSILQFWFPVKGGWGDASLWSPLSASSDTMICTELVETYGKGQQWEAEDKKKKEKKDKDGPRQAQDVGTPGYAMDVFKRNYFLRIWPLLSELLFRILGLYSVSNRQPFFQTLGSPRIAANDPCPFLRFDDQSLQMSLSLFPDSEDSQWSNWQRAVSAVVHVTRSLHYTGLTLWAHSIRLAVRQRTQALASSKSHAQGLMAARAMANRLAPSIN